MTSDLLLSTFVLFWFHSIPLMFNLGAIIGIVYSYMAGWLVRNKLKKQWMKVQQSNMRYNSDICLKNLHQSWSWNFPHIKLEQYSPKHNIQAINPFLKFPWPLTIPTTFALVCHCYFNHSTKWNITPGCVSSCVVSRDCAQRNSCYTVDTGGAFPQCECSCGFLMFCDKRSSCHTAGREMVVRQNVLLGVPWEWSVV